MPAVTLAGALALAGCGGSDNKPAAVQNNDDDDNGPVIQTQCLDGTTVTAPDTCPVPPSESAFAKAGGTPGALLNKEGNLVLNNVLATALPKSSDRIAGLHGSANPGMKWHEALNASKVSLTIGTGNGALTGEGYAIKVTGKKLTDLQRGSGNDLAAANTDKGGVNDDAVYMGVEGQLVCNADNCKAPSGSGGLIGDWYFIADDADAEVVKNGDKYALRATKPHADWGVWLTDATAGAGKQIQRLRTAGPTASLNLAIVNGLPKTATYTGGAVGVSTLHKSGDDAAAVGSFTADAELKVTFHTEPKLEGTIKGFDGDAVNTGWELKLMESTIDSSGGTLADSGGATHRQTKGGSAAAQPNGWQAQLYGEANKRPSGVVGDFDGRFVDGQAVGVFYAD